MWFWSGPAQLSWPSLGRRSIARGKRNRRRPNKADQEPPRRPYAVGPEKEKLSWLNTTRVVGTDWAPATTTGKKKATCHHYVIICNYFQFNNNNHKQNTHEHTQSQTWFGRPSLGHVVYWVQLSSKGEFNNWFLGRLLQADPAKGSPICECAKLMALQDRAE